MKYLEQLDQIINSWVFVHSVTITRLTWFKIKGQSVVKWKQLKKVTNLLIISQISFFYIFIVHCSKHFLYHGTGFFKPSVHNLIAYNFCQFLHREVQFLTFPKMFRWKQQYLNFFFTVYNHVMLCINVKENNSQSLWYA